MEEEDSNWWEKEELTREQKEEKFRKAERDAKWEKSMASSFPSSQGEGSRLPRKKFSRWGPEPKSPYFIIFLGRFCHWIFSTFSG